MCFNTRSRSCPDSALETLKAAGLTATDVDWMVPHQGNRRILEGVSKRLGIDMDRVIVTVQDHGNTSAASIPLALATAKAGGKLHKGQVIALGAIGGGLAWGSAVIRW